MPTAHSLCSIRRIQAKSYWLGIWPSQCYYCRVSCAAASCDFQILLFLSDGCMISLAKDCRNFYSSCNSSGFALLHEQSPAIITNMSRPVERTARSGPESDHAVEVSTSLWLSRTACLACYLNLCSFCWHQCD